MKFEKTDTISLLSTFLLSPFFVIILFFTILGFPTFISWNETIIQIVVLSRFYYKWSYAYHMIFLLWMLHLCMFYFELYTWLLRFCHTVWNLSFISRKTHGFWFLYIPSCLLSICCIYPRGITCFGLKFSSFMHSFLQNFLNIASLFLVLRVVWGSLGLVWFLPLYVP